MKVMVIVKASKDSEAGVMPSEQLLREMGQFNEVLVKAGILLSGEGLHPSSRGARVRFSGKNRSVINGPFAETKELIAGFWVWQVKSMEEAIEWVKRCPNPMLEDSEIEVRRLFAPEDFAESDPIGEILAHEKQLQADTEKYRLDGPRFEQGPEILMTGMSRNFTAETRDQIPPLWAKFVPHLDQIPGQVGNETYGLCYNEDEAGSFDYMAGVAVKNTEAIPSGFTVVRVPSQRYAVFNHRKHVSQICETMDAIYQKWLPNSGLKAAHAPAFEKYTEAFNPESGTGGIEIWIPVQV